MPPDLPLAALKRPSWSVRLLRPAWARLWPSLSRNRQAPCLSRLQPAAQNKAMQAAGGLGGLPAHAQPRARARVAASLHACEAGLTPGGHSQPPCPLSWWPYSW